jgi:hypothetical protein
MSKIEKTTVVPTYEGIKKVIIYFFKCIGLSSLIECRDDLVGGETLVFSKEEDKWLITPVGIDANKAVIVDRNDVSHFQKAHGTFNIGNRVFIGVRAISTIDGKSRFVCYPDINDLDTYEYLTFTGDISTASIEAMCYDSVRNKIYAPFSGTNKLLVVNASDTYDYQIITVTYAGPGTVFSGTIITDNVHIYSAKENVGTFHKILISNYTIVTTTTWIDNPSGSHSGVIDDTNSFGYFAANTVIGTNFSYFAKLNLANMTYIDMPLQVSNITDDIVFIPTIFPAPNTVVLIGETQGYNMQGVIVDVDTMRQYVIDLLPSVCIKYDAENNLLVSTSLDGFIETVDYTQMWEYITLGKSIKPIVNTYTIIDKDNLSATFMGNELFFTPSGYFCTFWEASDNLGRLAKIKLYKSIHASLTKKELEYRYPVYPEYNVVNIDDSVNYIISSKDLEYKTLLIANTDTNININIPQAINYNFVVGSTFEVMIKGFGDLQVLVSGIDTLSGNTTMSYNGNYKRFIITKISYTEWIIHEYVL